MVYSRPGLSLTPPKALILISSRPGLSLYRQPGRHGDQLGWQGRLYCRRPYPRYQAHSLAPDSPMAPDSPLLTTLVV